MTSYYSVTYVDWRNANFDVLDFRFPHVCRSTADRQQFW